LELVDKRTSEGAFWATHTSAVYLTEMDLWMDFRCSWVWWTPHDKHTRTLSFALTNVFTPPETLYCHSNTYWAAYL